MRQQLQIQILNDKEMRVANRTSLNRLCDITDWRVGSRISEIMLHLREAGYVHRKSWEYAACIEGMERLQVIHPAARAVAIGAGYERPLFHYANEIREMVATDLYDNPEHEGTPAMLTTPEKFAPFEYKRDHLKVLKMSGTELDFPDNTFDFAFTLSSIEHFGSRANSAKSMREMERVIKPGGVVCVATELILNEAQHHEYFTIPELEETILYSTEMKIAGGDIDLRISKSLLENPIDLDIGPDHSISPHIVLHSKGILWTSLILFFKKEI